MVWSASIQSRFLVWESWRIPPLLHPTRVKTVVCLRMKVCTPGVSNVEGYLHQVGSSFIIGEYIALRVYGKCWAPSGIL